MKTFQTYILLSYNCALCCCRVSNLDLLESSNFNISFHTLHGIRDDISIINFHFHVQHSAAVLGFECNNIDKANIRAFRVHLTQFLISCHIPKQYLLS